MAELKPLIKIIPDKLIKFSNYADKNGMTRQRVYQLEKEGKLKVVIIDGVKFVEIV